MFVTPYTVRFADVDNAGIFYYPRFFHIFHVAFEQWWETDVGRPYNIVLHEDKVGFPPVHIDCDFRKSVTFGDPLDVQISVLKIGRTSVVFRYEIVHRDTGEVHCGATITKAIMDMETFRAVEPSDSIREILERLAPSD